MKLSEYACPNVRCPDYGRRGRKNLFVYTRYGRKHVHLIGCRTCGKTFSELKGSPFWDARLDWNTIALIYISLIEGRGIRGTARSYGVSKNTVKRYLKLAEEDPVSIEHFLQQRGFLKEARSAGAQEADQQPKNSSQTSLKTHPKKKKKTSCIYQKYMVNCPHKRCDLIPFLLFPVFPSDFLTNRETPYGCSTPHPRD